MKTRDNMSAMIEGLQREHGLLAAYLEATDNHKRVAIAETPKQVFAAPQLPEVPQLPQVVPPTSPFVLRRANLVRIWPGTWISENGEPSGTAPSHSRIYSPQAEMAPRAAVRFQLARLTAWMDGAARRLEVATAPMRAAIRFQLARLTACMGGAARRLETATAPMRAAVRLQLARLTAWMDGAARRLEVATAPMRAAVRFQLARLTARMDGAARRLEAATAPVQGQRKFAVFVVASLVVASFAGTYFHDGITAVMAQYPAHSDALPSGLAGASRQTDSQEAFSRKVTEEAEQRQAMEGTVTELRQALQQQREKTMALEQQTKAARPKQEAERRIAELQPGARRDQTHGPQPSSSAGGGAKSHLLSRRRSYRDLRFFCFSLFDGSGRCN
jgi:hypothetical protein